jgi:LysM repeat protein
MRAFFILVGLVGLASCTSRAGIPAAAKDAALEPPTPRTSLSTTSAGSASAEAADAGAPAADSKKMVVSGLPGKAGKYDVSVASTPADLAEYFRTHVPKGGSVSSESPPKVTHTVAAGETFSSIAVAYLPLSELYTANELTNAITKKNREGAIVGHAIEIPALTTRVIRDDPRDERLGWPEDRALRGVFITGPYAGIKWVETLDKLQERGLNAVVLDQKDYEGYINYPSKVPLVAETNAIHLHIPDLARAIRFAHWRGIRIILRIPCFHDPWTDKHAKDARMSIKFAPTGKPIHVDWLDPTNVEAQDYAIALAKEGIEAGADEIQLDYVRFPVHLSSKIAVLPPKEERPAIIRDFVKRVHDVTYASGVALSLDFFGVAATGDANDILYLGQHIPTVAPEADAISLMSYPSHYNKGYMGFPEPGEHPEVVGIGNTAAVKLLKPTGSSTIFRTWLQAFPLRSANYGPAYVVAEAKSAESTGGVGWLMWSPACEYSAVWNGFPPIKKKN